MLILNVTYQVKKGMRQAFYHKLQELKVPEKSREEEDNLAYEYFFHAEDEDRLFLLEKWKDEDAFQRHCKTGHFLALQEVKGEYVESADLQKILYKVGGKSLTGPNNCDILLDCKPHRIGLWKGSKNRILPMMARLV